MANFFTKAVFLSRHLNKMCFVTTPRMYSSGRRWDPFGHIADTFRDMERQMREIDKEFSRSFQGFDRSMPALRSFRPFQWLYSRDVPLETHDGENYKLQFDVSDFKPEDIKVTLKGNQLTVRARRETKRDDGSQYLKEFSHSVTLPDGVDPESVRSMLEPNGVLNVEAPMKLPEPEQPREIPVQKEEPDSKK